MNYYVYRHIRLDTGEPFYIGLGKKIERFYSYEGEYRRAYSRQGRSRHWERVASKGYLVEILMELETREEVIEKEIEFINLYGRRDLYTGSLVNLTSGGDGLAELSVSSKKLIADKNRAHQTGRKRDSSWISNMSKSKLGIKYSPESIDKSALRRKGLKRTPEQIANIKAGMLRSKQTK